MNRVGALALLLALGSCTADRGRDAGAKRAQAAGARVLHEHIIAIPPELHVPYTGRFRDSFPGGFAPGVGSGLRFLGRDGDALRFLVTTDRGPNTDAPLVIGAGSPRVTKAFPVPGYAPFFGEVRVDASGARLISATPYRSERGDTMSGIPPDPETVGAVLDVPLDETLERIPPGLHSLDPEAIDMDSAGHLWIGDEYGPFVVQIDARSGIVQKRYRPGDGLPAILSHRMSNRGIEGIAVTPSGKVHALLESVLDVNGETRRTARFLRLVELNPRTSATRTFAYPHDFDEYASSGDAKLGDLASIDDHRFLLVEQGRDRSGRLRNLVYRIDLSRATDLTGLTLTDGRALEYGTAEELRALGVTMIAKQFVLDLRGLGWSAEKAEGLAIVDDQTIAVASDDDFGLRGRVAGGAETAPTRYHTDGGHLYRDGAPAPADARYVLAPHDAGSGCALWVIRLARPLR